MSADINYYDWIPFFKAICNGINRFATNTNTREQSLIEIGNSIFNADHPIFNYPNLDPISFIYAFAQRNTINQRDRIFNNAKLAFNIPDKIPTDTIFPTPTPNTPSLFHDNGNYINRAGTVVGNNCLWNLFIQAYNAEAISEGDLQMVLSLKNVGFTKISQVLFLINPTRFIPFDTQMNSLPIPGLENLSQVVSKINAEGSKIYLEAIESLKASFPGCELYEINLLNVLINSNYSDQLKISSRYCQISSWASGQEESDFFEDFVKKNSVWTGGKGSTNGTKTYPVRDYKPGDIVLVRRGTKNLGGIAVIVNNQYLINGFDEDKSIQVIWLVKKHHRIPDDALGQWDGFSHASEKTIKKFKEAYPTTFEILNAIRNKQRIMVNHSIVKYKNLILQGPPGTGKTRLAKQIAEWLIDESEKSIPLISAIDQKIFSKEPDIEGKDQIKLIQFHPSYTYEDFVRGIKANVGEKGLEYVVENRILAKFAQEASKLENQHKAFVLIIDEINRANLTSVLGELIYALEYRGKSVSSMYEYKSSNEISLPHNLYIIGTMNTADRSVSQIDYAIRRRFTFIPVLPEESAILHPKAKSLFISISALFNDFTSPEFNKDDIQIGHSYFLVDDTEIAMKLKYEIQPLLFEYIKDGVLLESAKETIRNLHA